uniref:Replicative helicase n=1 Tax=Siphoviridae sp. ct6GI21 TaxID=2825340 RepID=A0A8S5U4A7_9CAUD|nr:MAG TPA: Replicative helicase [Siphoviridae sp. ct6GI21]
MNINQCWYKRICTEKCSENCIRYKLMYSLFKQSNLPEALWGYKELICHEKDLQVYKKLQAKSDAILNFIEEGNNLYIYSENCGNGKTTWAIRLMYSYFDKIWHKSCFDCKALFVSVPKFLYNCKRSISQDVKGFEELCNLISEVDLVIWDDIGEMKASDYEHQILFQYIDDRINSKKSNIYTSNKNKEQLEDVLGVRLASRIYNCSERIEFLEEDKRGKY